MSVMSLRMLPPDYVEHSDDGVLDLEMFSADSPGGASVLTSGADVTADTSASVVSGSTANDEISPVWKNNRVTTDSKTKFWSKF